MADADKRRSHRESIASQETLISLQQVDPSPLHSPDLEKQLPDLPPQPPSKSTSIGLSGSGHGTIYYLTRIQRYTSYTFLLFSTAHITNTSLIPLLTRSVPASEPYLLLTRPYYQSFPLEQALLVLPVSLHVLSGLILRLHRRNIALTRYGASTLPWTERLKSHVKLWPALSWTSLAGYILVPLVGSHAFVNRMIPWIYEGGSSSVGLGFVSHGFAEHPVLSWAWYGAMVGVATGHFVWGMAKWMGWIVGGRVNEKKAKERWWTIQGAWAALAVTWMAGGLGVVGRGGLAEGWVGRGYDSLYAKVPLVKL